MHTCMLERLGPCTHAGLGRCAAVCKALPANAGPPIDQLQITHSEDAPGPVQPFAAARQHLSDLLAELGVAEGDHLVVRLLGPGTCPCSQPSDDKGAAQDPPPRHVNLLPCWATWPPYPASQRPSNACAKQRRYRLEEFRPDSVVDVLLCRPELLGGPLDARLLLLQALHGLWALHGTQRAHGRLSLSSLLLKDRQCGPSLPLT